MNSEPPTITALRKKGVIVDGSVSFLEMFEYHQTHRKEIKKGFAKAIEHLLWHRSGRSVRLQKRKHNLFASRTEWGFDFGLIWIKERHVWLRLGFIELYYWKKP